MEIEPNFTGFDNTKNVLNKVASLLRNQSKIAMGNSSYMECYEYCL
jgi:hypothetical protein